jgi:hypothetical protein
MGDGGPEAPTTTAAGGEGADRGSGEGRPSHLTPSGEAPASPRAAASPAPDTPGPAGPGPSEADGGPPVRHAGYCKWFAPAKGAFFFVKFFFFFAAQPLAHWKGRKKKGDLPRARLTPPSCPTSPSLVSRLRLHCARRRGGVGHRRAVCAPGES